MPRTAKFLPPSNRLEEMVALDDYRPDQWHDFFIIVGGAAAVLTGLVFVAMSLSVNVITQDATHRHRAIGTLTGASQPSSSARSLS